MTRPIARVRRRDTDEPGAVVTPSGTGYGFLPDDDGDSKPVDLTDRADAIYFADHEDFKVEWLDQEPPPV